MVVSKLSNSQNFSNEIEIDDDDDFDMPRGADLPFDRIPYMSKN